MATTLAARVSELEQKVAALSDKVEHSDDWRSIVGQLSDTEFSREADELGRQIRAAEKNP